MLIESIKLENFRQFRNEYVEFALGENNQNVTICIGDNGAGKTTFEQAFFWCLYGETEFSDKIILNKHAAIELAPGEKASVKVTLRLKHGSIDYTLIREQVYTKNYSNKVSGDNTVFNIARKGHDGNTVYVKPTLCESEVKSILPKELSRYFFFDGERIEKMSKEISTGKKSSDFADAVNGLLGLNAMMSAIAHFKGKNGVIGKYESSFDGSSDVKIQQYTDTIKRCNDEIERIDSRLEELQVQTEMANQRKGQKTAELKQYEDGERLQRQKEKYLHIIDAAEKAQASVCKEMFKEFNTGMSPFFSKSLVYRALKMLEGQDFKGKDIPYMHVKTIEYLLNQGVCICGTHLDEGTMPYEKVKSLMEFLPPQSLSSTVSDFKTEARTRMGRMTDLREAVEAGSIAISKQNEEIENATVELSQVEDQLDGKDVSNKVRAINEEIRICEKTIKANGDERDKLNQIRGRREDERDRADTERRNLSLLDDKNKKVEIYKAYAEQIFSELIEAYSKSETAIRERLQDTINEIFKDIYQGGLYLTIDSKYHITVFATDYEGDVETSTAQSISVIFAFITGIIKMARENRNADNEDAKLLSSEPYPLVMDAPLSAFDKRRIKTVCKALPETAEQVIIFIKDTDGDLAEEHMGDRIGSRHHFIKKDEFDTELD